MFTVLELCNGKPAPVSLAIVSMSTVTNSSHNFLAVETLSRHTPQEALCVLSQVMPLAILYSLINQPPNV